MSPLAITRNARRLFEYCPPLLMISGNHRVNTALLQHRISTGPKARIKEQVPDILEPYPLAIDHVGALAAGLETPGYGDLRRVIRKQSARVIEYQSDFRETHRRPTD